MKESNPINLLTAFVVFPDEAFAATVDYVCALVDGVELVQRTHTDVHALSFSRHRTCTGLIDELLNTGFALTDLFGYLDMRAGILGITWVLY